MDKRVDTFETVAGFLDFIGRGVLRGRGISNGQMRNWVHRDGVIPARHIPLFATLCAERGRDVPFHLFSVDQRNDEDAA